MKLYFVFFGHAPRKIRVRSFATNHAFWSGISAATLHATHNDNCELKNYFF